MENSKKSISPSSTPIPEEKHEELSNNPLLHQHPIPSPASFNFPSFRQTPNSLFPINQEGARYLINSDGYVTNNNAVLSDRNQTFQEKPIILEISNGLNIIHCITKFAQHYEVSVTVLCGDGLISEVDIMYPRSATPPVHVYGCYRMISFSGTYSCLSIVSSGDVASCFTVSLIDGEGKITGGLIASTLKAASDVTLVALITNNLS